MSAAGTPGDAAQWLLLDLPGSPHASQLLSQCFAGTRRHGLFENTDLHSLGEHGPLLVALDEHSPLTALSQSDPQTWPGLFLVSTAPLQVLLAHLRRMLTVTLGLHYKGLLSYYNPQTASYFFDACDARELSRWLGPISQVRWYGGTWADKAVGSLGWQQLLNPRLPDSELAIEHSLSSRQQDKLQSCLLERHAYHWSRSTGSDYSVIWCHMQEGLRHGFSDNVVLDGWLQLRLRHPAAIFPERLMGATQRERLEQVREAWERGQP
jgi:hypothetical protein